MLRPPSLAKRASHRSGLALFCHSHGTLGRMTGSSPRHVLIAVQAMSALLHLEKLVTGLGGPVVGQGVFAGATARTGFALPHAFGVLGRGSHGGLQLKIRRCVLSEPGEGYKDYGRCAASQRKNPGEAGPVSRRATTTRCPMRGRRSCGPLGPGLNRRPRRQTRLTRKTHFFQIDTRPTGQPRRHGAGAWPHRAAPWRHLPRSASTPPPPWGSRPRNRSAPG